MKKTPEITPLIRAFWAAIPEEVWENEPADTLEELDEWQLALLDSGIRAAIAASPDCLHWSEDMEAAPVGDYLFLETDESQGEAQRDGVTFDGLYGWEWADGRRVRSTPIRWAPMPARKESA